MSGAAITCCNACCGTRRRSLRRSGSAANKTRSDTKAPGSLWLARRASEGGPRWRVGLTRMIRAIAYEIRLITRYVTLFKEAAMFRVALLCSSVPFLLLSATANTGPPEGQPHPRPILTIHAHAKIATCVRFSPCGKRLATGGRDHRAAIWDAVTGKRLFILDNYTDAFFTGLSFSPDGKRLAGWDRSPALKIWDAETGRQLLNLPDSR